MIFDPILLSQNRLRDPLWWSRSGPFLALCLSEVPLKYNTFALGTQKCAPGEHKGEIFVKRQTYSLKICFLYSFKAHFWMVPIFDDFAPSLFGPSASGSSLPFSKALVGTLSGGIWASFWACSGARNPPRRASRPHVHPVLVQSCLRIVFAAPISPPTNENLDVMYKTKAYE